MNILFPLARLTWLRLQSQGTTTLSGGWPLRKATSSEVSKLSHCSSLEFSSCHDISSHRYHYISFNFDTTCWNSSKHTLLLYSHESWYQFNCILLNKCHDICLDIYVVIFYWIKHNWTDMTVEVYACLNFNKLH